MTTEQMKELYATGEWIAIAKRYDSNNWITTQLASFSPKFTWKLIHKKHKHILDHVLSGGQVRSELNCCIESGDFFFKEYTIEDDYEIVPKNDGSLEHEEYQCITNANYCATCRKEARVCKCKSKPKPPKPITREEALQSMEVFIGDAFQQRKEINYRWFIPTIFDYIEYLEANQKEK